MLSLRIDGSKELDMSLILSLFPSLPSRPRVHVPLGVHMCLNTRVNIPEISLECQFFP